MGLINQKPAKPAARELFRPYSDEEKALLAKKYTPEQIRAIEAGEGAIRAEDLDQQGVIRTDIGSLPYLDDFRHYRSVVDKKPPDNTPVDPNARFMTEDELAGSFMEYFDKVKKENPPPPDPMFLGERDPEEFDPTRLNFWRADYESPRYMGTNGPIPSGPNLFAPALPKTISVDGSKKVTEDGKAMKADGEQKADPRDPDGTYNRLRKQTGLSLDDIFRLDVKIVVQHQVTNQTRLGRVRSMYCLAIAGNKNGQLGIGQAKGQESTNTAALARANAIRNMRPIPRYEERTIYGDVEAKVSAVRVKLMARPPGDFYTVTNLEVAPY
jgi:small subunit ribosomal protein S5